MKQKKNFYQWFINSVKKKFEFYILGSDWDEEKEINFYEKIIGNKDWVLKKRTIHNNSYYWTDQSELTIFVDSI